MEGKMERRNMPESKAVVTTWEERWNSVLACPWSALALFLVGALFLGIGYWIRPVNRQEVILLTHQSFELPGGGSLSLSGEGIREKDRTLTGTAEGTAIVRIGRLTEVDEYAVSVFAPAERGDVEQRVGVDSYISLAPNPREYPVSWQSSDTSVATVKDGVVTGITPGIVTVTEILNDYLTYTYKVTVTHPELERDHFSFYPGQTVPLKVNHYSQKVEWSSDNSAVKVNRDGTIKTVKPGRAMLTTRLGEEPLSCCVEVAKLPTMEKQVTLRTDETAQLHVYNALAKVKFHSADETVAQVDQWGHITPVSAGITTVTAKFGKRELTARVAVYLTPEEEFRVTNYGPYQPEDASVAALAMLGMCDYYNDWIKASGDTWYDTNLTSFSSKDTFQEAISARNKGADCTCLLNWSWVDMGLKSGSATTLYGMRDSGDIHGYNGGNHSLRSLVDSCCNVYYADEEKTSTLESRGELRSGDMLFMPLHTFIYRGKGTVFASAGDSHCRRVGRDIIILDCINGYSSYNWRKRITYVMRFRDDYIPRYYRNKEGEVVENPMYIAQQKGESPWTGKRSPTQRQTEGLEPVTFQLGVKPGTTEESQDAGKTSETKGQKEEQEEQVKTEDSSANGQEDADDTLIPPVTGDIVAEIPETAAEEQVPRMAGGKPYGSWPSSGKKAKKKDKKGKKSNHKDSQTATGGKG